MSVDIEIPSRKVSYNKESASMLHNIAQANNVRMEDQADGGGKNIGEYLSHQELIQQINRAGSNFRRAPPPQT